MMPTCLPTYSFLPSPAQVRPVVLEELRLEVDEEMRALIQSIKACAGRGCGADGQGGRGGGGRMLR